MTRLRSKDCAVALAGAHGAADQESNKHGKSRIGRDEMQGFRCIECNEIFEREASEHWRRRCFICWLRLRHPNVVSKAIGREWIARAKQILAGAR